MIASLITRATHTILLQWRSTSHFECVLLVNYLSKGFKAYMGVFWDLDQLKLLLGNLEAADVSFN